MSLATMFGGIEKAQLNIYTPGDLLSFGSEIKREMQVQFNPSSLIYFASSEAITQSSFRQQKLKDMRLQQMAKPIAGQLAFQLVFDEVEAFDAFASDKALLLSTTPNPTAVLKAIGGGIKNAFTGPPSVRSKLCALTTVILAPEVLDVEFQWGELRVRGKVSEVETNFTMFSPIGEPIRGTIQMRISENVAATDAAGEINRAFKAVFKDNRADARSVSQKVGNILNLNI